MRCLDHVQAVSPAGDGVRAGWLLLSHKSWRLLGFALASASLWEGLEMATTGRFRGGCRRKSRFSSF